MSRSLLELALTVVFELLETTSTGFLGSFAGDSIPGQIAPAILTLTLPRANLCSKFDKLFMVIKSTGLPSQ